MKNTVEVILSLAVMLMICPAVSAPAAAQDARVRRADSLASAGKLREAAGLLREVYSDNTENVEALKKLGGVCMRLGDLTAAHQAYDRAIDMNQFDVDAYLELGRIAWLDNRHDQALEYIDMAEKVAVEPNPKIPAYRSVVYRSTGRLEEADSVLVTALDSFPDSPIILSNLGLVTALLQGPEDGFEYVYRAYDIDTSDIYTLSSLASLYLANGNVDSATAYYEKALRIDPGNYFLKSNLEDIDRTARVMQVPVLMQEGVDYFEKALYSKARKSFSAVIEIDSSFFDAYVNLGFTLNLLGEPRRAASIFEKAEALDSTSAPLYIGWGNSLAGLGEYDGALLKYDRAFDLDSTITEIQQARDVVQSLKQAEEEEEK
jgi:tetratricopeptide (TPR) repeat protein